MAEIIPFEPVPVIRVQGDEHLLLLRQVFLFMGESFPRNGIKIFWLQPSMAASVAERVLKFVFGASFRTVKTSGRSAYDELV